jgi:Resolvase, N terminal domain
VLDALKPGDTLVIYKPDRIARSMKELLVLLEDELRARDANLENLTGVCAGLHKPNGQTIADKMLFMVASAAVRMLPDGCVLDGELMSSIDGRLNFDALQRRLVTSPAKARNLVATVPASYVVFDLLAIGRRSAHPALGRTPSTPGATVGGVGAAAAAVTGNRRHRGSLGVVRRIARGDERRGPGREGRELPVRRCPAYRELLKVNSVGVAVRRGHHRDIRPGQQWFAWSLTVSDTCRTRCGRQFAVTPRGSAVGRCDGGE